MLKKKQSGKKQGSGFAILLIVSVVLVWGLSACGDKNPEFTEFQWPKSEVANLLPIPESNIGNISWETSNGFLIYVGETSKAQYNAYVDECWEKGFTIDYSKDDNYFWARNEDGYTISLSYESNNIMWISADAPKDISEENEFSSDSMLKIDWTRESFYELSFDVPVDWRKKEEGDDVLAYTATNDIDSGGFVIRFFEVGRRLTTDEIKENFENGDFDDLFNDVYSIEYDLEIADHYAVKTITREDDLNYILYFVFTDYNLYIIALVGNENDSVIYEEIFEIMLDSIIITKESNQLDNNGTNSVFSPQDVSDATIRSIQTYADYLAMFRKIVEDYLANYEAAVKGTILYDEKTFADIKRQQGEAFEAQKVLYESLGNTRLIGKDTLVDFLISYRDSLKEITDMLAETLKILG